jgi:hypothetical protein
MVGSTTTSIRFQGVNLHFHSIPRGRCKLHNSNCLNCYSNFNWMASNCKINGCKLGYQKEKEINILSLLGWGIIKIALSHRAEKDLLLLSLVVLPDEGHGLCLWLGLRPWEHNDFGLYLFRALLGAYCFLVFFSLRCLYRRSDSLSSETKNSPKVCDSG